jgi:hypothetical protein
MAHFYNRTHYQPHQHFQSQLLPLQPVQLPNPTNIYLHQLENVRRDWSDAVKHVSSSVATIKTLNCQHLGCGVLVGIDKLLVPYHVIQGMPLNQISINFNVDDAYHQRTVPQRFCVLDVHDVRSELDFCILQLSQAHGGPFNSLYPGQILPIPSQSCSTHLDEFALVHANENGEQVVSLGNPQPCRNPGNYLCSYSGTIQGSSGGAYFDKSGQLIAIHLHGGTGSCNRNWGEGRAIFLCDIIPNSPILSRPGAICQPYCAPPYIPASLPRRIENTFCYDNHSGTIPGSYWYRGKKYSYCEVTPGNSGGPGPRYINFSLPNGQRALYRLIPEFGDGVLRNPHHVDDYNDKRKQKILYANAAEAFYKDNIPIELPYKFQFEAYRVIFSACRSTEVLEEPQSVFDHLGFGVAIPANGGISGVFVNAVKPGSAAERSGIKLGMLISSINGMNIHSVEEFEQFLGQIIQPKLLCRAGSKSFILHLQSE